MIKASENSFTVSSSLSLAYCANPRKIWDKITPELPRAPINKPRLKIFATVDSDSDPLFVTSEIPFKIVKDIFVPVSPSGTGNTFMASTALR